MKEFPVKPPAISSPTNSEIISIIQKADALPLEAFNKVEAAKTVADSFIPIINNTPALIVQLKAGV